jgi:hypothetical protein
MITKADLNILYTSIEPFVSQLNPSQSIGGYPSDSLYSESGNLLSTLSVASASVPVSTALSGANLLIDDEIISTQGTGATRTVLERGALSTSVRPHVAGVPVYSVPSSPLFNNALSDGLSQYRCLAVKNTSQTDTFYNLAFYFKETSLTPYTSVKLAVEVPATEYYSGEVGTGSLISIVDSGLEGNADNKFSGCVVKILSGQNINARRTVLSFDSDTNTLVLDASLPYALAADDEYEIQPAPAQSVAAGTVEPVFGSSRVSNLSAANGRSGSIGINVTGSRVHGGHLAPNEVVYLWLSRTRAANAPAKLNNRVIFTMSYDTEFTRPSFTPTPSPTPG